MSDAVATKVLIDGPRNVIVKRTCVSDGTGEADAVFMDLSTFSAGVGHVPLSLSIDRIEWDIKGSPAVRLQFDATTDDEAIVLGSGSGAMDWTGAGGLKDPRSSGYTGDILITRASPASGDTYTITLYCHKKC